MYGVAILLTSCADVSRTGVIAPFAYTEVKPNEVRVDLDLNETNRVSGEAKQFYIGFIRVSGGNKYFEDNTMKPSMFGRRTNKARSCAIYNALEKGGYDVILNPQYKNIVHRWFFGLVKRYDVTVTGFGGKVRRLYQTDKPTEYQTIRQD